MKTLFFIILITVLVGCEKTMQADLQTSPSQLVIDAAISWEKGQEGDVQTIRLSTTTGYYQSMLPVASGAIVFIKDDHNNIFDFTEQPGTGNYVCNHFVPMMNRSYELTVVYSGQTYKALDTLFAVPAITDIGQQNDLGLGSDEIGVKIRFDDIPNEENFYLLSVRSPVKAFPEHNIIEDQYNPGTHISWLYTHPDLRPADNVAIKLTGISKRHYNYMKILIQASGANAGPFQTPLTNPKGNIINQTSPWKRSTRLFQFIRNANRIIHRSMTEKISCL